MTDKEENQNEEYFFDSETHKDYMIIYWCKDPDVNNIIDKHTAMVTEWGNEARSRILHRCDIKYGNSDRCVLDIYNEDLPKDSPIFVFIHGGYWQFGSNKPYGFIGENFRDSGIVVATVEYDLAPQVKITDMVEQIKQAMSFIVKLAEQRGSRGIYIAGHSAGAHLAAMLSSTEWMEDAKNRKYLKGIILISGLFDLIPLLKTGIAKEIKLTKEVAELANPFNLINETSSRIPSNVKVLVTVGGFDPPKFIFQSKNYHEDIHNLEKDNKFVIRLRNFAELELSENGVSASFLLVTDEDHMTIVRRLREKDYILTNEILKMMSKGN